MHPVIAQMGQVGLLEKGEGNLASLAPEWVILGVFCAFFFDTIFPESVSFPAAELIRERDHKTRLSWGLWKCFPCFSGNGPWTKYFMSLGGGNYLVIKAELPVLALASLSFQGLPGKDPLG